MTSDVTIRAFDRVSDLDDLRTCIIELQEHEREVYARLPPGTEVVDDCISHMLAQCEKCDGRIFVAEDDGRWCGFVTVLNRVVSEEPDDGKLEYGLVSDLVVLRSQRGKGIGRLLMAYAERHARASQVAWLRVGVLAGNRAAESLYASLGFRPWYAELEKSLINSGN